MKTKYFSPLFGLTAMAMGFTGSDYSYAIPTNNSEDIYSDSLYIQRSSAEIPSSFESSARQNQQLAEMEPDAGTERVLESLTDLDEEAPVKAVSVNKKKKSSRN